MSPVRYWVVRQLSKEALTNVAHFKSEEEANKFLASVFFKEYYESGVVECVNFEIYETSVEAKDNSIQKLRESGLAKLSSLTKKEAIALGVEHLLIKNKEVVNVPLGNKAPSIEDLSE